MLAPLLHPAPRSGKGDHPAQQGGPPPPHFVRGRIKRNRSRDAFMRPSFANHDDAKNRFASGNKKREAERRKAHAIHVRAAQTSVRSCATHLLRGCAPFRGTPPFRRSRSRHSPPAITPMAQPQNRVSRRRTAQVFCPFGRLSSVKHAPCRPVVVPVDRGPRAARERIGISARGHRPSLPSFRLALPERRPP